MKNDVHEKIMKYIQESIEYFQDKSLNYGLSVHERYLFKLGIEVLEDMALEGRLMNGGLFSGIHPTTTEKN
jgi:hypothetical protein